MQRLFRLLAALPALALVAGTASAQWGTIKGKVVWDGGAIPANPEANVDKDKAVCLADKKAIYRNELLVDEKTKGVKNVIVWLGDPEKAKNEKFVPKIHPDLEKVGKDFEIDQPCCTFEPRVVVLREGQNLVVKNSMSIPHNFAIPKPSFNQLIPANAKATVKGFTATKLPTPYNCTIHAWMKGYVHTVPHPYFAVTNDKGEFEIKNAPAGKFRLIVWHEAAGWVVTNPKDGDNRGITKRLPAGGTADLGAIKLTVAKD